MKHPQFKKQMTSMTALAILVLLTGCSGPSIKLFTDSADPLVEYTLEKGSDDKVLVLSMDGLISNQPSEGLLRTRPGMVQEFVSQLDKAKEDSDIRALVLKINSPGGTVTASDILYQEVMNYKEMTGVPVIAVMMDVAASGGYYVALAADHILAHPTTMTGSIGVIFMTPDLRELLDKIGVGMNVTKSGTLKDMGSPWRARTAEEEIIFQDLIDTMATRFKDKVMKHRKLSTQAMTTVATARIFLPEEAKQLGLIDQVGYLRDAVPAASQIAKLETSPTVVVYRRSQHANDNMYNGALNHSGGKPVTLIETGLNEHLGGMKTGLYYLWLPGSGN